MLICTSFQSFDFFSCCSLSAEVFEAFSSALRFCNLNPSVSGLKVKPGHHLFHLLRQLEVQIWSVTVRWWECPQKSAGKHISISSLEITFSAYPPASKENDLYFIGPEPFPLPPFLCALWLSFLRCCWSLCWWALSPRTLGLNFGDQKVTDGSGENPLAKSLK